MASKTKILAAIFGPSIPTEQAAVLPEILGHIRAIDDLLQGKPRQQAHPRITDPAISGQINSRILAIYAEHGWSWPKIAAAISQEFGVLMSPDACRGRYKDAMRRKEAATLREGYAALSGEAIQAGIYTTPEKAMQADAKEDPAEPIVDPGEQQVAIRSNDQQIEAMKKEVIRRHNAGEDVKSIAKSIGVRWQWVRAVCARAPKPEQEDKSDAPSEKVLPPEPPAEPPAQSSIIPERLPPQTISRAELDAKMWALHMAGKNPEEIADALYSEGFYYSAKSVRVRLISQGAKL